MALSSGMPFLALLFVYASYQFEKCTLLSSCISLLLKMLIVSFSYR